MAGTRPSGRPNFWHTPKHAYDWRRKGIYLPDFRKATPVAWSYRDLVFLRLLAWLRQARWERPDAAAAVAEVRRRASAGEPPRYVRADSTTLVLGREPFGAEPSRNSIAV